MKLSPLYMLLLVLAILPIILPAQSELIRGRSTTASGMLFYDIEDAADQRTRTYLHTICPEKATCITLDFNLVFAKDEVDFIRVFDGNSTDDPLIAELGGESGSMLIQGNSGCITVEFSRDARGLHSTWTALWRSQEKGECIQPGESSECPEVQEICGPVYREQFHYFGAKDGNYPNSEAACLEKVHNSSWYKFMIAHDGELQFTIQPGNGFDDYDWGLWKADPDRKIPCPVRDSLELRMACNYAAGRGGQGTTGMSENGDKHMVDAGGNPFSRPITVKKGEIYFLLIDDYSEHSSGFELSFNDVVLQCENPGKDFLRLAYTPPKSRPRIHPRDLFSSQTKIISLSLDEKANLPLLESPIPPKLFQHFAPEGSKDLYADLSSGVGLIQILLEALKKGRIPAYAAHDFRTPLHYGDLLQMAYRSSGEEPESEPGDSIFGPQNHSWWHADPDLFMNLEMVVEFIVEDIFDKRKGQRNRLIRYVRILWVDDEAEAPDFNVLVFRYEDVAPLLELIPVVNRHNDAPGINIRGFLENQQYQGRIIHNGSKVPASGETQKYVPAGNYQLGDYNWSK